MNPAMRNATLFAMADELTRALRSDPEDDHALRGVLVFSGEQYLPLPWTWDEPSLYHFPVHGAGLARPELWSNPHVKQMVVVSLALCGMVGLLFGFLITYLLVTYLRKVVKDMWLREEANQKLLFEKRFQSEAEDLYIQHRNADGDRSRPASNPFQSPYRLITKVFIDPLRRKYIDSLAGFVSASLEVVDGNAGGRRVEEGERRKSSASPQPPASEEAKEQQVPHQHPPYIWLRDLCRYYDVYCLEHRLDAERSRNAIQRRLIAEHNVRVKSLIVDRLYGIKWRKNAAAATPPEDAHDSAALVRCFVETHCDEDADEWLDLETRAGEDTKPDFGFKPCLEEWCRSNDLTPPRLELGSADWCERALPKVRVQRQMKARQICGLKIGTVGKGYKVDLSSAWYALEALTVFVHFAVYAPPLIVAAYTLSAQNFWALYVCPPAADHQGAPSVHPLTWLDVFTLDSAERSTRQVPLAAWLLLGESFVFIVLAMIRQVLNYLDLELPAPPTARSEESESGSSFEISGFRFRVSFESVYRWVHWASMVYTDAFAVIFAAHLCLSFSLIGVLACWFLLATALDPSVFLPYGVGAITLATVTTQLATQLLASATAVKEAMKLVFMNMVQDRVDKAAEKLTSGLRRAKQQQANAVIEGAFDKVAPPMASDERRGGGDADEEGRQQKVASPNDVFALLNIEGDELSKEEFKAMFKVLDLSLSESQQEQLFALCDVDCSGSISEEEFVQGWDLMVETFVDEGAESVGLGKMQILGIVGYVLTSLSLVIGFILVTLAAWSNEDNFGAVVQSLLIGGAGRTSSQARAKSDAEDPEKVDGLVQGLMSEQKGPDEEG